MSSRSYFFQGVLPIAAAAMIWAVSYALRKESVTLLAPVLNNCLTSAVTCVASFAFDRSVTLTGCYRTFLRHPLDFLLLAIVGTVLGTTLFIFALSRIDLGVAAMLEKAQPLLVLVFAWLFLRERFPMHKLPAAAIILICSFFIAVPDPSRVFTMASTHFIGILSVILAALFWSVSTVLGKKLVLSGVAPSEIVAIRFAITTIALLPGFLFITPLHLAFTLTPFSVFVVLFIGVVSGSVALRWYYLGMQHVTAGVTSFLELLTPLGSVAIGTLILHERMTLTQLVAVPIFLLALLWVVQPTKKRTAEDLLLPTLTHE